MKKYLLHLLFTFSGFSAYAQDSIPAYQEEVLYARETLAPNIVVGGLNELIKEYPEDVWLYIQRGELNEVVGDFENAFLDYQKIIELDPENPKGWFGRAGIYGKFRKYDLAIADCTTALELNPDKEMMVMLLVFRSGNFSYTQQKEKAFEDLERAYELDPDNILVLNNLAAELDERSEKKEAQKILRKIKKLDPSFFGAYINLGFLLTEDGDYEGAIEEYNQAIKLAPEVPHSWNNRGYVKYKIGDYEGAIKDINHSLKLDPDNSYAYRNRALIWIADGEKDLICKDLQMALDKGFTRTFNSTEVEELFEKHCN